MSKVSKGKKTSPRKIISEKEIHSESMTSTQKPSSKSGLKQVIIKTSLLPTLAVALASLAVYCNSLFNGFVYDDHFQVVANPWVKNVKYIPAIFSKNVWNFISDPTLAPNSSYYRPLMYLIYLLNYYVFGLQPWAFHLVNILFHATNSVLVFSIASKLLRKTDLATPAQASTFPTVYLSPPFIAALLFALHPIHTEAVTWIACLPEVSFTFFTLLSFSFYIRSTSGQENNQLYFVLSLGLFFLAALCKETALTLPLILVVYDYAFHKGRFSFNFKRYVSFGIIAGIYLVLRYNAIGNIASVQKQYGYLSTSQYVINVFPLFLQYLKKLLLPINLNAYYVLHPILSLSDPRGFFALIIVAVFFLFVGISLVKNRVILLCLSIITIPLLPAFYIPGLGRNTFTERYLYLPSVGFVVLLAIFYAWISKRMSRYSLAIIAFLMLLAISYSLQTITRNYAWENDLLLFTDTVKKSPDSEEANGWVAYSLMESGREDEAVEQFKKTLTINPYSVRSHKFLGDLLLKKGLREEAISHYEKVVSMFPNDLDAHQGLADAFMASGMIDRAKEQYQIIAKLNPDSVAVYVNLGTELAKKDLINEAIVQYEKALAMDPNSVDAHYNMGSAYANSGLIDKAIEHFKIAVRLQPQSAFYHDSLGRAYKLKGLHREAIDEFKKAIQIAPEEPAYRNDLDTTVVQNKSNGK